MSVVFDHLFWRLGSGWRWSCLPKRWFRWCISCFCCRLHVYFFFLGAVIYFLFPLNALRIIVSLDLSNLNQRETVFFSRALEELLWREDGSVVGVWFHSFRTDREPRTSCSLLLTAHLRVFFFLKDLADSRQRSSKTDRVSYLQSPGKMMKVSLIAAFLMINLTCAGEDL